jgi:hypothetical protein
MLSNQRTDSFLVIAANAATRAAMISALAAMMWNRSLRVM